MSIDKKLQAIQSELEVPKSQYNSFGKYNYRNAEDILAAAKPVCHKHGCLLMVEDDMVILGDRYYVKATATIMDGEESLTATAYARESEEKKGMDAAQVTGAASSYARKYALNGLFCLDDVKDADYSNKHDHGSVAIDPDAVDTSDLDVSEEEAAAEFGSVHVGGNGSSGCEKCGVEMTAGQITVSKNKFDGHQYCLNCRKEIR